MKRLLILTRFPPEYEPQRLAEEARKKGIKPEIVNYQNAEGLNLLEFDYVIPRSAAHRHKKSLLNRKMALIKALSRRTICLNKKSYLEWSKLGKIKQAETLSKNDLPVIPTLEKPVFPAILKAEFGSHSRRVIRVKSQKEASEAMRIYSGKWFYQPIIKTPFYWRVMVLNGRSLGIMERKTSEKFVKTEEGEKPRVDKSQIDALAIKATQLFKAEMAGVDLLAEKDKLMVIEVNRSPQFQIFDRLTKANVAQEVINYLTLASK